jgi:hypothetical protein
MTLNNLHLPVFHRAFRKWRVAKGLLITIGRVFHFVSFGVAGLAFLCLTLEPRSIKNVLHSLAVIAACFQSRLYFKIVPLRIIFETYLARTSPDVWGRF